MDERELKLNSLSRYTKASPLYILEEHGHCEVPAGCGGVVLRWRNPRAGVPFTMWLYTDGPADMYLDGSVPSSARPLVAFGTHVLAFELSAYDPARAALMFAGVCKPGEETQVSGSPHPVVETAVLSALDGSWRYSLEEPQDDAWTRPDFDDDGWQPMEFRGDPQPAEDTERDPDMYRVRKLAELGAFSLGVSGPGGRVWIRKVFTIPDPFAAR